MSRYVDLETDIKPYLGGDSEKHDALLTRIINSAEEAIDTYCRRRFAPKTMTRYYSQFYPRCYGKLLFLDDDLLEVTTLTNGNEQVIANDQYWLEPRGEVPYGYIRLKASTVWTFNTDGEITITGRWGWCENPPADVVQAVVRLASFMYRQRTTNNDMDRPMTSGDGVIVMPAPLPNDVLALLKPYQRMEIYS